jgi:hypothetical protein
LGVPSGLNRRERQYSSFCSSVTCAANGEVFGANASATSVLIWSIHSARSLAISSSGF